MYEDEPEVDHVERTRFPWQWFSQDIELLELKVRGDWAIVGIEKSGKQFPPGDYRGSPRTNRGTIAWISTPVT